MARVDILAQPDVVIRAEAEVGEGPVIDDRTGRLCWVDMLHGLFETDLITGDQVLSRLETTIGAAVPRENNPGFAVAVAEGFGFLVDGELEVCDPVLPEPHRRMNDAKCDSSGRLWAGSTHREFVPGDGALHCWTGDAPSRVVRSGFTLPNGIGWNEQDDTMYLADSVTRELFSAPFHSDEGIVGELSRFIASEGPGLPDGLAVDRDGCIWLAIWGGSEVHRYSSSGELIARVPLPVEQPSSCAFGADGTLYITSARAGLSQPQLREQPLAGSVFALSTTTRGVPIHAFAG